jgi:hypothetical protein
MRISFSIVWGFTGSYNMEQEDKTMDFTGKVAISTGAASDMRLLFAQNFAAMGRNAMSRRV